MITLTEAPAGSILGGLNTVSDLDDVVVPVSPAGSRSLASGINITSGYFPGFSFGTMAGALNLANGEITLPAIGYYSFTTFISLSIDSPIGGGSYNNLYTEAPLPAPPGTPGPPNPNGFMGLVSGTPSSSSSAFPVNYPDYFGSFTIGIGDLSGGIIICANSQTITYDTSHILMSASYTLRYVSTTPFKVILKYLNKTNNSIRGRSGNSFHVSITHIQ
jgi:hypothetical protein